MAHALARRDHDIRKHAGALAAAPPGRELFAVPEMGPLWLGYNLHAFPSSWDEAKVLREQIERAWRRALKKWRPPK
jgi:hypothetical protein